VELERGFQALAHGHQAGRVAFTAAPPGSAGSSLGITIQQTM
jgi:hypothetical protein